MQRRVHRLQLLSAVAEQLLAAREPDREVLPTLFESLRSGFGVDAILSYSVAENDCGLVLGYYAGISKANAALMAASVGREVCGDTADSRRPTSVAHLQSAHDSRVDFIKKLGFRAITCEPLLAGERLLGTMAFATRRSDEFDPEDLTFFRALSRLLAVARDRARTTAALEQSEARLRLALQGAQAGVWDVHIGAEVAYWSPEFRELYGFRQDEQATEEKWVQRVHPDDMSSIRANIAALLEGRQDEITQEFRIIHPERGTRWLLDFARARRDASGSVASFGGVNFDITERKKVEETQQLLLGELNHRVKNTLSTVQAIASQTLRRARSMEEFAASFQGRLHALARSHTLLTYSSWTGADLARLISEQLTLGADRDLRVSISGPDVFLAPQAALHLGLVLHELGTNARKHGALSVPEGRIDISWELVPSEEGRTLDLRWVERDGPEVRPPDASGFGVTLIQRSLASAMGGGVDLRFDKSGLNCEIRLAYKEREGRASSSR